ncbi:MAG: hypothetical protein Q9212_000898 [Teloschistes hypoglaucus]
MAGTTLAKLVQILDDNEASIAAIVKFKSLADQLLEHCPLSPLPRREWPTEHPWDGVLRIDSLTLAPAVEYHIAKHGADPAPFMEDRNVLWNMSFVSYEDNFTANYNWTEALEWRMTRDRLRWCFAAMMYFDISKFLKPRRSCQLDANMVDRMRETLHISYDPGVDPDEIRRRFNRWAHYGRKFDFICGEFGPGALFFLHNAKLESHVYLETTWDRNDLYEREAFGYLEKLDLRQKAKESGANELARNIRQYLIEPFENQIAVEE